MGNMKEHKPSKKPLVYYCIVVAVVMLLLNSLVFPALMEAQVREVGYNEFLQMVDAGQVEQVARDDAEGLITFLATNDAGRERVYKTGIWPDETLMERLEKAGVKFAAAIPTQSSPLLTFLLTWILPILIFAALGQFMMRKLQSGGIGPNAMSFGKANAKVYVEAQTGKTFADVAGEDEAKEALTEIVDFLHNPGKAPCIVFIDEIDTIGKKRDGGGLGGNDEREQTLNQLLTEMDGFDGKNGVVILAATNRPDSLDPALLRPGRFDRRIPVELPDLGGREAILKVHAKDVHMAADIDYNAVARATSGASGAELANIVNEAALRAVRMGRDVVEQADLEESVEVVIAGYQRKSAVISEQEKKIVAYHEIGHALVAAKQSDSAPVHKITIVPRTSGALGYTMQVEEGERFLMSREEAFNKLATLTGGRTAEELIFRSATTGASNDIEQATRLARAMVTRYGMSSRFGMVALETVENAYLGGDTSLACSQETAALVDREVVALVKDAQEKAREILTENTDALHRLSKYLLEKETITGEEFMQMLNERA